MLGWLFALVIGLDVSTPPRLFEPGHVDSSTASTAAAIERVQIQRHLREVEQTLRKETPTELTEEQASARAAALDALHDYWRAGRFPVNRDYPRFVPYFIDAEGTQCAVGHLMAASGAEAMAREIATYENNEFVADIDHPGLGPWLEANGLTAAEAAWIQPQYGPCTTDSVGYVCGEDGLTYECSTIADECGVAIEYEGACDTQKGSVRVVYACQEGETDPDMESEDGGKKGGCAIVEPTALWALLIPVIGVLRRRRH